MQEVNEVNKEEEITQIQENINDLLQKYETLKAKHIRLEFRFNILDLVLDKVCKNLSKANFSLTEDELNAFKQLADINMRKDNPDLI